MGGGRESTHADVYGMCLKKYNKTKIFKHNFLFKLWFPENFKMCLELNLCDFVFSVGLLGGADIAWAQTR